MKLTISTKLIGMMVVAALVPVAVVGIVSFLRASTALTEAGLSKVEQEASLTDRDLNTFLGQFSSDLLAFSATPPIQGIIRARDNDGIDTKSNDPYEVWVNRLTQIFKANAINKEFYQQLRYIDENGDEMVKTMNDVSTITEPNSAASEQMAAALNARSTVISLKYANAMGRPSLTGMPTPTCSIARLSQRRICQLITSATTVSTSSVCAPIGPSSGTRPASIIARASASMMRRSVSSLTGFPARYSRAVLSGESKSLDLKASFSARMIPLLCGGWKNFSSERTVCPSAGGSPGRAA